jgi:prefoldin subunit 5
METKNGYILSACVIIASLIVAFGPSIRSAVWDLESRVSRLQSLMEDLKKSSDAQTNEIRELRKAIEEQRKGVGEKQK